TTTAARSRAHGHRHRSRAASSARPGGTSGAPRPSGRSRGDLRVLVDEGIGGPRLLEALMLPGGTAEHHVALHTIVLRPAPVSLTCPESSTSPASTSSRRRVRVPDTLIRRPRATTTA